MPTRDPLRRRLEFAQILPIYAGPGRDRRRCPRPMPGGTVNVAGCEYPPSPATTFYTHNVPIWTLPLALHSAAPLVQTADPRTVITSAPRRWNPGVPCQISRAAMVAPTWTGLIEWQTIKAPVVV